MTSSPAVSTERTTYRNFVGGEWVASKSSNSTPNLNPADTRDVLGHTPLSTADETRRAVDAAKAAFPAWRDTPAPVRGSILFRAQAILDKEKDELARLLSREEGKTVKEALGEIQRSINILEYIAAEGRRLGGHTVPSELHNFCYTVRQPVGVVACITPWTSRGDPGLEDRSRAGRGKHRGLQAGVAHPRPRRPPSSPSSNGPGSRRAC